MGCAAARPSSRAARGALGVPAHAASHRVYARRVASPPRRRYPPDPGLFVTAAYDGLVRAWDADALQPALDFELHGRVYALHLSPVASSHGLVAVGSEESAVRLCDLRSGARTHLLHGHSAPVWAVQWSTGREHVLASGSRDGRALMWDVRRPGAVHALDRAHAGARGGRAEGGEGGVAGAQRRRASAHDGGVNGLLFSPDGSELLTFGKDDRLRLWDAESGRLLHVSYEGAANAAPRNITLAATACGGPGTAHACAYVPCGRLLHVYEWATGALVSRLRGHFERVNAVALADGAVGGAAELLLSASDDASICAWAPPSDALGAAPAATAAPPSRAPIAATARQAARPARGARAAGAARRTSRPVGAAGARARAPVDRADAARVGARLNEDAWSDADEASGDGDDGLAPGWSG